MEKKDLCSIIKDLLPSYVEKLTNEETNKFIESHIDNCPECKETLENMRREIEINAPKEDKTNFKYIKKYSKRLKLFRNILLIIALVFVLVVARRFIIITDLSNKADKMQALTNYNIKAEYYFKGRISVYEKYNKDNISLTTEKIYYIDNLNNAIVYINYNADNEELNLTNDIQQLNSTITDKNLLTDTANYSLNFYTIFKKLSVSLTTNIQKVDLEGNQSYLMKIQNTERFIDANTGLLLKFIDNNKNKVVDYHYEFGTVTDEDVARPDTTGYTIIDNK